MFQFLDFPFVRIFWRLKHFINAEFPAECWLNALCLSDMPRGCLVWYFRDVLMIMFNLLMIKRKRGKYQMSTIFVKKGIDTLFGIFLYLASFVFRPFGNL